jgi:hypothetical protein
VLNPDGKSKGIKEIRVDGKLQASNIIPVFGDSKVHPVEVIMG